MTSAGLRLAAERVGRGVRGGAFAIVFTASLASTADGATYYVDNRSAGCSSNGPGTEDRPYCTIAAAVTARGGPDVTIVVKPGIYREQVAVGASGAPGMPFVIRADGPGVVIDGADGFGDVRLWDGEVVRLDGRGQTAGTSIWVARGVTWSPDQVFVDGVRLAGPLPGADRLTPGGFAWVAGEGLYVDLGGVNPGTRAIRVGRRSHGFSMLGRSWVTVEGFEIIGTQDRGVSVRTGCSDIVIARNRVSLVDGYGIRVAGSTGVLVEENVVSACRDNGIGLIDGTTGSTVRNNEAFGNAHPTIRTAKGIYLNRAPGNTLVGNRLHHNQDTGMQINAGSNGCIVYNNLSWNNGDHGYDHLDAAGTIHLNNVAYGNYKDGFSIEADSPNTRIYNCIAIENGITTGEYNLWVNGPSSAGFVSDYNIFWNSTAQPPIKYVATKYATLAGYRAVSGQDAHSHQADPLFVDAPGGDFSLMPGSPAIDAGTSDLPFWPATDAAGRARLDDSTIPDTGAGPVSYVDIGALEFWSPSDMARAELPGTRTTPGAGARIGLPDAAASSPGETWPATISLSGGFPNPSRGAVEFVMDLPRDARVEWTVYDLQGRMVWSEARTLGAGRALLRWEGRAQGGEPTGSGVYLVRARVEGAEITRRVVRL